MKKLMVMFGMAVAAVSLNAASIDWSTAKKSFKMADGSTMPNGTTVYLLNKTADAAKWTAFTDGLTKGTLGDNLAAVLTSTAFTGVNVGSAETWSGTAGSSQHKANYGYIASATASASAVDTYSYVAFIVDGDKYLMSGAVEGTSYLSDPTEGAKASFGTTQFTTAGGATDWTLYSAPEPTSGLLLLIGMAGLALRRRRA